MRRKESKKEGEKKKGKEEENEKGSNDRKGVESEGVNESVFLFLNRVGIRDVEDYVFIILLILVVSFLIGVLSGLKQLPGPLYGGDVYFHFASIKHLENGGSIFKSAQYLGEWQHYSWLLYVLVFWFSKLFHLTTQKADVLFPAIIVGLSMIVKYVLGVFAFKNKTIALLFSISDFTTSFVSHPTVLATYVFFPIIPLMFYLLKEGSKNKPKYLFIAGLLYGFSGLTHVAVFLSLNIFLLLMFVSEVIDVVKSKKGKNGKVFNKEVINSIKNDMKKYIIVLLIGIPIAMLYWAPLIVYYHGKTLNPWQEYVSYGLERNLEFVINALKGLFFNFSNFYNTITTLLFYLGLLSIVSFKSDRNRMLLLLFLTGFIGITHPYITKPLLKTSFGYFRFVITLYVWKSLVALSGVLLLFELLKRVLGDDSSKSKGGVGIRSKIMAKSIIGIVFMILFLTSFINSVNAFKTNKWTKVGYSMDDFAKAQFDFARLVERTVGNDEVIITSHGETGFAINALTGKKVLFIRKTHSSPFVDVDKRIADAAIILYGNNTELRNELIKNYRIKYYYTDYYSEKARRDCLNNWDKFSDPNYYELSYSCLRTSPKYKDYLVSNGLEVKEVVARIDVAQLKAPRKKLIIIKPSTGQSMIKVNLTPIKVVSYQNQTIFGLYKINS